MSAIDNVIGLKYETGDLTTALEILESVGDKVAMIGDAGMASYMLTHSRGAPANITGTGQFAPQVPIAFHQALDNGDLAEARRIALDVEVPLGAQALAMGWVAHMKSAMELCGLPGGPMRRPGVSLTASQKREVRDLLCRLGLLP